MAHPRITQAQARANHHELQTGRFSSHVMRVGTVLFATGKGALAGGAVGGPVGAVLGGLAGGGTVAAAQVAAYGAGRILSHLTEKGRPAVRKAALLTSAARHSAGNSTHPRDKNGKFSRK